MSAGFFAEPQRPRFGLQHAFRDCAIAIAACKDCWVAAVSAGSRFSRIPAQTRCISAFVHDAGRILNPALFDGQVRGGFAMAIGAALYERFVYTDTAVS